MEIGRSHAAATVDQANRLAAPCYAGILLFCVVEIPSGDLKCGRSR